jgi:hypothetical protein
MHESTIFIGVFVFLLQRYLVDEEYLFWTPYFSLNRFKKINALWANTKKISLNIQETSLKSHQQKKLHTTHFHSHHKKAIIQRIKKQ